MKTQKHEPIIWDSTMQIPLTNFLETAKGLNLDYVIYVQDSEGGNKSVWSCTKEDFNECMFTLSNKCYFGRVQSLAVAIEFGFDDELRNN